MTNGRINKRSALLAILCVLVMVFAVPVASAASYSKVYGQTQDKVRVRESASTNATIIDNIVKDACIYITSSKTSGSNTFVQVKYRASDGSTATGWVCQSDGRNTYVKVLSTDQAKSKFKVSSGDLPSKAVGTFTAAERKASAANSDTTYIRENSSGATVSKVQTELKALGYYYGQITGNAGPKTVAAIKSFQGKNGLTADGIAGPQTIAKIDAAYEAKGGSSSGSGSSASGLKLNSKGTDVRNLQQDLTTLGYYWAEITGNFGERTEAAVKRFQEENGLTADGVAGTKTLNGGGCPQGRHTRFRRQRGHDAQAEQPGHEGQPASDGFEAAWLLLCGYHRQLRREDRGGREGLPEGEEPDGGRHRRPRHAGQALFRVGAAQDGQRERGGQRLHAAQGGRVRP